ncbi:uncharacterized protein [Aristolochia californica]|uniref:uncharacterized protein n=1 Tax=Aristolochia californica TaxID=171875 RepID=UPI0035DD826D
MLAPICSIQTHNGLRTPSLINGIGMKPFQVSKSIDFRSPVHFPRGNEPSLPTPTRSLTVKNRYSGGGSNEQGIPNPTTPVSTYIRLFKENDFLTPKAQTAPIDKKVYLSQVPQIRKIAVQLIKSGKIDEAERMLQVWCDFSEDKYPLQTLLVETLIYQGKFEEANKLCAVGEVGPSDARPLLKAVAYAMFSQDLDEEAERCRNLSKEYEDQAKKWWETFSSHLTVEEDPNALGKQLSLDRAMFFEYSKELNKEIQKYKSAEKEDKGEQGKMITVT